MNAVQIFANVRRRRRACPWSVKSACRTLNVPDSSTGVRYGRSFVFGIATHPDYGPVAAAVPGGCPILNTPNQPGCENAGFVTDFSWGYRLRGQWPALAANAMNLGVTR